MWFYRSYSGRKRVSQNTTGSLPSQGKSEQRAFYWWFPRLQSTTVHSPSSWLFRRDRMTLPDWAHRPAMPGKQEGLSLNLEASTRENTTATSWSAEGRLNREWNAEANTLLQSCSAFAVVLVQCLHHRPVHGLNCNVQAQQELHIPTAVLTGIEDNLSFSPVGSVRLNWAYFEWKDNSVGENCDVPLHQIQLRWAVGFTASEWKMTSNHSPCLNSQ